LTGLPAARALRHQRPRAPAGPAPDTRPSQATPWAATPRPHRPRHPPSLVARRVSDGCLGRCVWGRPWSRADGDGNAELSNANKSFADHRVTGDPPCSSPRRRAASTQILESTNNHKPYFIKRRTGFCLLGFISDVLTTSLAEERANSRAEKEDAERPVHVAKIMGREEFLR
jgi:hypothetical protein